MPISYLDYPQNWLHEIRPRILHRAKFKCEVCGLRQYQMVYSVLISGKRFWLPVISNVMSSLDTTKRVQVILTIAHLNHDHTNQAITDNNLKALCQKCHLAHDRRSNTLKRRLRRM